jgi:hypothetical protein
VFGGSGFHRTEASVVRAVRALGHASMLVDAARWRRLGPLAGPAVRRLVRAYAPDVVILTRYAADLDDETLAAVTQGRSTALWFFDLVQDPHERIVRLGRAAGTMYVTCPSQIDLYRASGVATVRFLPQAADPAIDRPATRARPRYRCDVSFVGSGQYPHRHALLRRVAQVCDLQIRGPGWEDLAGELPVAGGPVRGGRFAQAVRGAAISLGAVATPSQACERACASNRMWKVMGCGGFYLGPRVPGIEHFARDGEHCAWYDSPDHALDLVREYLAAPGVRTAVAEAGRKHALAEHTYADRVRLLLEERGYPVP